MYRHIDAQAVGVIPLTEASANGPSGGKRLIEAEKEQGRWAASSEDDRVWCVICQESFPKGLGSRHKLRHSKEFLVTQPGGMERLRARCNTNYGV